MKYKTQKPRRIESFQHLDQDFIDQQIIEVRNIKELLFLKVNSQAMNKVKFNKSPLLLHLDITE